MQPLDFPGVNNKMQIGLWISIRFTLEIPKGNRNYNETYKPYTKMIKHSVFLTNNMNCLVKAFICLVSSEEWNGRLITTLLHKKISNTISFYKCLNSHVISEFYTVYTITR